MKRVVFALGMVVALAAYVWFVASPSSNSGTSSTSSSTRAHDRGPVIMYGDSLLVQSTPYLRSTDEVRAYGGTALCDWVDKIAKASSVEQPSVLVLEFVGNDLTPCMQGYQTPDQIRAK